MSQHRILLIEHQAYLCIDIGRLVIRRQKLDPAYILPADIDVLCLHHPAITVSVQAIQILAESGVIVLFVDNKHQPIAQLYPLLAPMRQTLRLFQQWKLNNQPLRGILWQQLVKGRLLSEAATLKALNKTGYLFLQRLAALVEPGDSGQCEGQGARHYWKHLFCKQFNRIKQGADDGINVRLNFGYAVLRSMICRSLICIGLNGCIGLGHRNLQNPFNLADDFIEPYRFLIEWQVVKNIIENQNQEFDGSAKKEILQALILDIPFEKCDYRVPTAIDTTISSFAKILDNLDGKKTVLPLVLPSYEKWALTVGE